MKDIGRKVWKIGEKELKGNFKVDIIEKYFCDYVDWGYFLLCFKYWMSDIC